MTTDYCKLNQVVILLMAAVPEVVSLREKINIILGTLYTIIDLANAFPLYTDLQ